MMALFVVGVVSSGVYFISNKIIVERKLSAQLRKDIHANLALRSITDYIKYGIRKGWCFDDKLLPEKPETCVNNFENADSTMRLMMPPSYAQTLETLGRDHATDFPSLAGKKAENLMLRKIEKKLNFSSFSFSQAHPLYRVLANVRSHLVKGLNITIKRVGNVTMPVNGDEVYLEITAEFMGADGKTLHTGIEVLTEDGKSTTSSGNQLFREVARFVSNPREINSFALMLPGTIYIGQSSPPEPGHGDLAIPEGNTSNRGMVFNSPVFINENIVLGNSGYTPVTFNDVVVLGNGIIKNSDGTPFKINDSLGVKRYWTDLKTFGGFIRGIDSDGRRDLGLSTLNGVSDSTVLNNDIITQCINIIRSQSDPDMTSGTRLVAEPTEGAALGDELSECTNRFSFSDIPSGALNMFVPQIIKENDVKVGSNNLDKPFNKSDADASTISYSLSPSYDLASGTKLVMWAYMNWDGEKLKIPILENAAGDGHTVTIDFRTYSKDQYDVARMAFDSASATLKARQDLLVTLESTKPASGASTTVINAWNASASGTAYANLNITNKYSSKYHMSIASAIEEKNDIEPEYLRRKEYYENFGQLQITSTKPNNGFTQRQNVFRNVTVKINNPEYFRTRKTKSKKVWDPASGTVIYETEIKFDETIKDFSIEGMDYSAVTGGVSTRAKTAFKAITNDPSVNAVADINNAHFEFKIDTSKPEKPLVMSNKVRNWKDNLVDLGKFKPLDYKINYQATINKCFDSAGGTNLDAFKPASFSSADFTSVAPDSWHFASPDPKTTYYNEDIVSNSFDFKIAATRDTCTIHEGASIVTGFFVCRNLNILARSTPLEMIGTFIVTKNLTVDPTALSAGVFWSSIHNQTAVLSLKEANASGLPTLRKANGNNCSTLYNPAVPFWHPDPGLDVLADRIRCSSTFLLQGKGPPRWTSVDPDCGRIGDSTNTRCLKRIRNFNLIQLERVYGQ
jgi:hypothetical protein